MDFIFKVDPIRRNIKVPDGFTVLTMDHNVHKLVFVCPYYEDFAFDSASIVFMVDAPDGSHYIIPAEEYESFPNSPAPYVRFTLTLRSYITSVVGYMSFCITADIISSGNVIEKSWHSKNISISIGGHIDNDDSEDIPEEDVPTINQRLNNIDSKVGRLQTTVNGMANGTPPTASSTSGMDPDESTVYINTTDGNWYYYDGSAWQIGGQYGGAVTDTTLSISGSAADAKAAGDALAGKADSSDVTALDTRTTAVEGDVSDLSDRVDSIEDKLTAEAQVPLVYYAHKFISNAGNVTTYASYNSYNFDLTGIEKVSVTSRNNGKNKSRLIAFYSSEDGIAENLLLTGELYEAYDETYHTEIFDVPDGAVSAYVVSDNSSPEPVVKKIYTIDLKSELDDLNDSVGTIEKSVDKIDGLFEDVKGKYVEITLKNGTIANQNNTQAVCSENSIPCAYGDVVTIYPVRPLADPDGEYRSVYTIYDGNGTQLKAVTTSVARLDISISYANAASIKVGLFEFDGDGNNLILRKDTYGYVPYVIVSDGSDLMTRVDALEDTTNGTYEDLLSQARYSDTSGATHLTLLHFSDAHDNLACMTGAVELADKYIEKIDDMIHTGDTVLANFSHGIAKWVSSGCAERAMNCIGNHDYYANSNLSMNDHASKADIYNTFLAPYVSGWGVTQPTGVDDSTSAYYCACYYYKDYADKGIRMIVLDSEQWDSAQLTWFTATLESARTAGYAVIVASHIPSGAVIGLDGSNFNHVTSPDLSAGTPTYATITEDASNAVDSFISAGGHFVVWLCGHFHRGGFGYVQNHSDIFVMSAEKAGTARTSGQARIDGERNANSYNLVSVDPTDHLIRLVRYGADVDGWLRGRHVFTYDYSAKTIISQW